MSTANFQSKILSQIKSPEQYRVYRACIEWDLTDPIVIESSEDFKSASRWRDLVEPYHHQVTNLITFCRRLPVTLLADDVGLGKTISAGLIISELLSRSRLSKVLIVAPKILGSQWKEELETKFNIPTQNPEGRELVDVEPEDIGAVITTYQSARLHLDAIPKDRFQMLILDEAHKLRNLYGTGEAPMVAKCFKKALEERRFRFVLMLTATPIHNRLWDIYSLIDLLTVARGHQNPFGSEGMFARKFIADRREQARRLKPEAQDEFRSIVYTYMSRVRRGDTNLFFPDRVVQMHRVPPTLAEKKLIEAIAKPIQKLNRLVQINILQALASSPDALLAQLINMVRNKTIPEDLMESVRKIVNEMPLSAKLTGLGDLVALLQKENPDKWRLVIFTGRIETQTSIQAFLEKFGLKVGIINGQSGSRNRDTIAKFKETPPAYHVIVSTEAGSEGVNLQVANVLVNYDLPWNPMIVEQRIGRIQRLASDHASVGVFNIILKGTFEEYIVGRLMEKLQLASHAIGDIEALLEASLGDGEEDGDLDTKSFEEKILQLVLAALAGKDYEEATLKAEQSIAEAKATLEKEEARINTLLGSNDGGEYSGPRAPKLPVTKPSMDVREMVLGALEGEGYKITKKSDIIYSIENAGQQRLISFEKSTEGKGQALLYSPGSPSFLSLIGRQTASGLHNVIDLDVDRIKESKKIAIEWLQRFGGSLLGIKGVTTWKLFDGTALIRVRATVAHDSYERLIEVTCNPSEHKKFSNSGIYQAIPRVIEDPKSLGLNVDTIINDVQEDSAISEFHRFYIERRTEEIRAAGNDERKRKKLEDEFTPRVEMTLVALEGKVSRQLEAELKYKLNSEYEYTTKITIRPSDSAVIKEPQFSTCSQSDKSVPVSCLGQCDVSRRIVLKEFLVRSEMSGRMALPEYFVRCSVSNKLVLNDEVESSDVSGRLVAYGILKTSAISGKKAEPENFSKCEFTMDDALNQELGTSEISGKRFRLDQQGCSSVSGKIGHKSEFILCHVTNLPILPSEAEKCELTGVFVKSGILETCEITGKHVLPSELEKCAVSGKKALRKLFVTSSISGASVLEEVAVRSIIGQFCLPLEAKYCSWSGTRTHPNDLKICHLTGLPVYSEFIRTNGIPKLQALSDLLTGIQRTEDGVEYWDVMGRKLEIVLGKGHCKICSATFSPDNTKLAACAEIRTLLGLRVRKVGFLYSLNDNTILGKISVE